MADERNRWLDRAAADRLLRGEPAEPVGPAADPRARIEAARLRAALDALAASAEPPSAGAELPGEAAAMAAFRAARPAGAPGAVRSRAALPDTTDEPLIDLGSRAAARAPRRARTVSFGLAAALASVAVGGLAAAAGAGLLERSRHDSAGPGPAMSVSADENRAPDTASGAPAPAPKLTPAPPTDGAHATAPSGAAQSPGADGRTAAGTGTDAGTSSGTSATGGSGKDAQGGQSGVGGKDGIQETFGTGDAAKEREREQNRLKAVDLCEEYRAGRLDGDRRERLARLANGITRIPDYCKTVLDGDSGGGRRSDSPLGDGTLRAPTLAPAVPQGSSGLRTSG